MGKGRAQTWDSKFKLGGSCCPQPAGTNAQLGNFNFRYTSFFYRSCPVYSFVSIIIIFFFWKRREKITPYCCGNILKVKKRSLNLLQLFRLQQFIWGSDPEDNNFILFFLRGSKQDLRILLLYEGHLQIGDTFIMLTTTLF